MTRWSRAERPTSGRCAPLAPSCGWRSGSGGSGRSLRAQQLGLRHDIGRSSASRSTSSRSPRCLARESWRRPPRCWPPCLAVGKGPQRSCAHLRGAVAILGSKPRRRPSRARPSSPTACRASSTLAAYGLLPWLRSSRDRTTAARRSGRGVYAGGAAFLVGAAAVRSPARSTIPARARLAHAGHRVVELSVPAWPARRGSSAGVGPRPDRSRSPRQRRSPATATPTPRCR